MYPTVLFSAVTVTNDVFAARPWCGAQGCALLLCSEMFVRAFDEEVFSHFRQMKTVIWATLGLFSASYLR